MKKEKKIHQEKKIRKNRKKYTKYEYGHVQKIPMFPCESVEQNRRNRTFFHFEIILQNIILEAKEQNRILRSELFVQRSFLFLTSNFSVLYNKTNPQNCQMILKNSFVRRSHKYKHLKITINSIIELKNNIKTIYNNNKTRNDCRKLHDNQ